MTTIMEETALRMCAFPIKVDHQILTPGRRLVEDDPDVIGMRDRVLSCLARVKARAARWLRNLRVYADLPPHRRTRSYLRAGAHPVHYMSRVSPEYQ